MARKKIVTPESESSDTDWDGQDSEDQTADDTQESGTEDVTRESVSEEEESEGTSSDNSDEETPEESSEEEPAPKRRNRSSKGSVTLEESSEESSEDEPVPKKRIRPSRKPDPEESEESEEDSSSEEEPQPRRVVSSRAHMSDSSGICWTGRAPANPGMSESPSSRSVKRSSLSAPEKIPRIKDSNEIFKELIKNQIPDVPSKWKLNINDMKRICKYVDRSIFDPNVCCLWKGYITNMNNLSKGTYVNFYFRNKKVALHRLLYSNFVAPLDETEYLKFNCEHKGVCCNVHHYERYRYSKNSSFTKEPKKEPKKEIKDSFVIGTDDPAKLVIDFD